MIRNVKQVLTPVAVGEPIDAGGLEPEATGDTKRAEA
jgi:hypothetical protein